MKVVEDFHRSLGTMAGLFGIPELHSVPVMFATRTRVAQKEGMCWRGGAAATPAHPFLLCSRASPCEDNGRNGYTRKPWEQWAYFLTHPLRRGRVDRPDFTCKGDYVLDKSALYTVALVGLYMLGAS